MNLFKKNKANYKGSSDHLKKKFNVHKIVNFRMQIFIGICVFLASVLIYRLYVIQVVDAAHFQALYEKYQTPDDKYNTKRGDFLDRNGVELLSSKGVNNIVYAPEKSLKDTERWDTAERFAIKFDMEFTLTEREMKDLWLRFNKDVELFTEEEVQQHKKDKLKTSEIDRLKRDKITEEMLSSLSEQDQETFKVYLLMGNKEENSTAVIYEDASVEDILYLAENQDQFLGFSSQITWEREINNDYGLSSIFGRIGQAQVEKAPYYQALNYAMNDVVGISGLEYQYEEILRGNKSVYSRNNENNDYVQISEGRPGYDLKLAIDTELQSFLEEELVRQLESIKNVPIRKYSNEMHAVVTDPRTGDVLAIAAMVRKDDGTYYNDPQRVLFDAHTVGSVVKPATVYMGLNEGAITPGTVFNDQPMYIKGTAPRHSYANLGRLNDIEAIQHSSNVYMFYTTIALAKSQYIPNGPLIFNDLDGTMRMMRNYYSQFGLGVMTGIDYPREIVGFKGNTSNSGLALEFSIGQYDSYTAMQLNQFVSTLANNGYRLKPRLVLEAGDFKAGRVVYQNPVEILNTLDNKEALSRVREGMRRCSDYNNCNGFSNGGISSAGKTGTAQVTYNGMAMSNHNFIAFSPFENPEIAISCIQPNAFIDNGAGGNLNHCGVLSGKIVQNYFK